MTSKAKDKARRRRPGRPKTTGPGALIGVRAQPDFLAKVDAWRNTQAVPPSRPQAIIHLVGLGLGIKATGA
jgi:hypothetical protein